MNKAFGAIVLATCVVGGAVALADGFGVDFESYALGSINGQDGWSSLGSIGSGCAVYDHSVVFNLSGAAPAAFGSRSLRVSNASTSGCFGDQTFSKPVANEAGESAASNAGQSGGIRQPHFEVEWQMASVVPTAVQPGLHYSASPDRGDGARMSYLRFEDNPAGIDVFFDDVQGTVPFGADGCTSVACANFVETQLATLNRSVPHTLKLSMDFYDGPGNDVVRVYIDHALVHTGTSWEDYYRFDPESYDGSPSRTVDSLLIRTGGDAAPLTFGKGFLIDNLTVASGAILIPPPTTQAQCKNDGWKTFNNPSFKNQGQCVSFAAHSK